MSSLSRRSLAFVIATAFASAHVPLPRAAAAEPTPADKSTARDAYVAGMDLRAKNDHKAALEKFKVAYALVPSPITALEVGRSLVDVGQLVEGSEKLLEAATMPAKANESAEAKKARVEARKRADEVTPRIPSITVKLENAPKGNASVVVTVDGRSIPIDALAAPLKVNPGPHEITATVEGADAKRRSVTVAEGETKDVTIRLPDQAVATRGASRGDPPRAAPRVEPGGTSTWTYVGFTVAGVGLVVGGVTGVMARSKASTLDGEGCTADHRCPSAASSDISAYNTLRYTSFGSLALAVVGVGIGIGGLASGGSSERPKAGLTVTPWVGVGSIGLQGAF